MLHICNYSPLYLFLETFTFNGHTLRTVVIDGEPWFAVRDVTRALNLSQWAYRDHKAAGLFTEGEVKDLFRRDYKTEGEFPPIFDGTAHRAPLVSESGLYKIILRAQRSNPAAREFQD